MDGEGLAGQPRIELRIWFGDELEVRVLSPAQAWSKCGRVDVANVERVEATSSRPGQGRHSWVIPQLPRPGAMRPVQQVFENGLVHLLGAGARTSTHTGHIHEGTPCRFPARVTH